MAPLALAALLWCSLLWAAGAMRADYLAQLRRETVDMFYHGYSNYMKHAFPEDELRPITCAPLTRDRDNPAHVGLNDALGNYSLTLIDSLSTLAILAGGPQDGSYTGSQALGDFQDGVADFVRYYGDGRPGPSGAGIRARGFDLDSKVQVFETVIRGVGGLLSAHLFAIGELPIEGYRPKPAGVQAADDPLELVPISWPNGLDYDGQLLRLALDLSQRLLPAFYTPTGIPYPRVNLRTGIPFYVNSPLHRHGASGGAVVEVEVEEEEERETEDGDEDEDEDEDGDGDGKGEPNTLPEVTETCSAGAGSLTLEFTVLSRLTGDPRFEQAAKRAFWEVWHRRSEIGLIGNGIDAERGSWIGYHSGIGAGMDSFFEYALKSHILLSGHGTPNTSATPPSRRHSSSWLDPNALHPPLPEEMQSSDAFLKAWHQAHASVKRYLYTDRSHYPYYSNGHRSTGQPYTMWIDSLGAFYPGLLALAGEVEEAIEANLVYTALWTRYSALPERWSVREGNVEAGIAWWPGRPEFIESTYHIYRATGDSWYLHVGEMVLRDVRRRCHAPCGWAGLEDVQTGEKQDRMESFFLGETTKYMYLLFDPDHPLNKLDANFVFSTEGHPLVIPKSTNPKPKPEFKPRPAAAATPEEAIMLGSRPRSTDIAAHYTSGYYDDNYTISCPAPPKMAAHSLAGSATAARPDLFSVSRFTDLYRTPNIHGPIEVAEIHDKKKGKVKRYRAASNHTLFPWTLPPSMLPERGTCLAPPQRLMSWIEFPSSVEGSMASSRFSSSGAPVVWLDHRGPTIKSLDGLRLQLEQTTPDDDPAWRITHVGHIQLGRHETVSFYAEHVAHFKDEAFTTRRRRDVLEIDIIVTFPPAAAADDDYDDDDGAATTTTTSLAPPSTPQSDHHSDSLLQSLLRAVSSVFEAPPHTVTQGSPHPIQPYRIHSFRALTSVGPGSFPPPSVLNTPTTGTPLFDPRTPLAGFPWHSIYLADHACDAPLPPSAPREHQVIVMRRGGCPFTHKLQNIPSFSPSTTSLQLVIVVDDAERDSLEYTDFDDNDNDNDIDDKNSSEAAGGLPRPLLQAEQLTPKGMKRLHGIPLVLLGAGRGTYDLFRNASAVGMRRKYRVESQGLAIHNAVVL